MCLATIAYVYAQLRSTCMCYYFKVTRSYLAARSYALL